MFESQIKRAMAGRLQGESGCGGLQVLLTGIEDTGDEHEMQVHRAGAHSRRRRGTSKSTTASPTSTSSPSKSGSRLEGLPTTKFRWR
jgi:hypothetical protein